MTECIQFVGAAAKFAYKSAVFKLYTFGYSYDY